MLRTEALHPISQLAVRAAPKAHGELAVTLAAVDLDYPSFLLLYCACKRSGHPLTIQRLCVSLGLTLGVASPRIRQLRERGLLEGWVARAERKRPLIPTAKGEELIARLEGRLWPATAEEEPAAAVFATN